MKRLLCAVMISIFIASCTSVGIGGTVSGGSSGHVDVGAGVNIQLYNESTNGTQDDRN